MHAGPAALGWRSDPAGRHADDFGRGVQSIPMRFLVLTLLLCSTFSACGTSTPEPSASLKTFSALDVVSACATWAVQIKTATPDKAALSTASAMGTPLPLQCVTDDGRAFSLPIP